MLNGFRFLDAGPSVKHAGYTQSMPTRGVAESNDYSSSKEWHQRILAMLEAAGLWARPDRDDVPSPVQFVYISQMVRSAGIVPVGEPHLCFAVGLQCPQQKLESLFTPHTAKFVSSYFYFRVPLSFFDRADSLAKDKR